MSFEGMAMPELWPFRPLFEVSETLEWFTNILPSRTGEQRISLRKAPRQVFNYSQILNANQYSWAKAFTRRNGALTIYAPAWFERKTLGPVDASQSVLTFDTTAGDFRVGSFLVVWQSWEQFVVAEIDSLDDTSITLTAPLGTDFTQASVMPVREAFFTQGMRAERVPTANRSTVRFQIIDNIDLNDLGTLNLYPTYDGLDVLMDYPHATASINENTIRSSEFIDNGFGIVAIEPLFNYSHFGQTITFLENLGSDLWTRRRWLHSLRGKQKAFWVPSFNNDLELQNTVTAAGVTLTVKRISVTGFYVNRHILIQLRNGNQYFREITNVIVNGDNDDLTIDSALGEEVYPEEVLFISFMVKTRLNADTISLEHRTANTVSIVLPVMEVSE